MAGYSENAASGSNQVYWNLHEQNGPIILTICEIDGTNRTIRTMQNFKAGDVGNPGSGSSANGPESYITFHLPFATYLNSDTTYGFELTIGNGGANYFEWLGVGDTNAYANGTAYHRSGNTITPLDGDHVFMADMTPLTEAPIGFAHPGTLHVQEDIDRMKNPDSPKVRHLNLQSTLLMAEQLFIDGPGFGAGAQLWGSCYRHSYSAGVVKYSAAGGNRFGCAI